MPKKYPPGYVKAKPRQVPVPKVARFKTERAAARHSLANVLVDLTERGGEFAQAAHHWAYHCEQEQRFLCAMAEMDFYAYQLQLARHVRWAEAAEA